MLLMDFRSFFELEVGEFFVQNCQIFKKIDFFTPASTVNRKNLGSYRSKILLPSARAAKTLQFGHQFFQNWSIQSGDISKFVKRVNFDPKIHPAK